MATEKVGGRVTLAEGCAGVLTGLWGTTRTAHSRVIPRAASALRRPSSLRPILHAPSGQQLAQELGARASFWDVKSCSSISQ